ncbi:hypothetical protein GPLA_4330 [Paraglaciecola polaris LMG 21857]|uniref:Uncharacterized protein n=1 Tax=Paraglaciecola polaris LMG 21857 TaxID=1129793 RepID=K6YR58_9ALTE|nr:hypothetical protein GPLA_4330 [Paraglaciecola polaris LMG 21857]
MDMPFKGLQCSQTRHQGELAKKVDQKIGDGTGDENGPKQRHTIVRTRFCHGGHATGTYIKPE